MKIGSVIENHNHEKRIAITPEIVKKYVSLGFEVYLSEKMGDFILLRKKNKFVSFTLGKRILRSETAAISSLVLFNSTQD